jgi:hypothetical protein
MIERLIRGLIAALKGDLLLVAISLVLSGVVYIITSLR